MGKKGGGGREKSHQDKTKYMQKDERLQLVDEEGGSGGWGG